MSKLKVMSSWFPSESGLFSILNSSILLLIFFLIKIKQIEIGLALIIVLICMDIIYGLINHEILVEEKN